MNNVMLDLETLGTSPGCIILSIGAVFFDKTGLGQEFYQTIDVQSSIDAGLTMSGGTFKWWMGQPGPARKALFEDPVKVRVALAYFSHWLEEHCDTKTVKVWGNGSDFDNTILSAACEKMGLETPWKFWNNRCYRTVCDVLNDKQRKQEGVHHHALDDAKSQAQHLRGLLTLRAVW
jgi:hypothetical protein